LMKSICIPASVSVLGREYFKLSKLESINFEAGSQLTRIESDSFLECPLTSIHIPARVEIIGEPASR
jgi:hypothetical protein